MSNIPVDPYPCTSDMCHEHAALRNTHQWHIRPLGSILSDVGGVPFDPSRGVLAHFDSGHPMMSDSPRHGIRGGAIHGTNHLYHRMPWFGGYGVHSMKPHGHDRDPMKNSNFDSLFRRDPTASTPFNPSASLAECILDSMDVRVEAFAICRIAQDAALVVPAISDLKIMYVLKGTLHLSVEGSEPLVSPTGSIILLPKNLTRTLSGQESTHRTFSVEEALHRGPHNLMFIDAFTGSEHEIRVLCGRIQIGVATDFDPFDGLVHPISAKPDNNTFVRSAFETMLDESRLRTAGSRILANTLMKACLVELLRHDLDQLHNPGSSSAVLLKPRVGRAVIAIISQPSAAHTVASLAKTAGMSRSAFAKAFVETTGATPIQFLARARLAKARDLIVATERSITSIAMAVGFASRSHFSSRFRERYGEDPTAYRKRARQKACPDTDEPPMALDTGHQS